MVIITLITILLSILMFEVLIVAHEFGHFIAARLSGVKVNEFAVGMGPAFFKKQRGETLYSLRALPIGGYCAMEGEEDGSQDPRAFNRVSGWRRFCILVAGSAMNFIVGFVILLILVSQLGTIPTNELKAFNKNFENAESTGILPGDKILKINGNNIYVYSDITLFLDRETGKPYEITVDRGGERLVLNTVALARKPYEYEGKTYMLYGLEFARENATVLSVPKNAWLNSADYVRLVRISLFDLITGRAGTDQLMGAVGIVDYMNTVSQQTQDFLERMSFFLNFAALVAINLAVMNLLPLPALDGGRIFFLLIEMVRRKPIDQKYESLVHAIGFVALMALMIYVSYNDIARIVGRIAGG